MVAPRIAAEHNSLLVDNSAKCRLLATELGIRAAVIKPLALSTGRTASAVRGSGSEVDRVLGGDKIMEISLRFRL
jgi:hypothetical protein